MSSATRIDRAAVALACTLLVTGCSVLLGMESSYVLDPGDAGSQQQQGDATAPTCVPGDFRCVGRDLQKCERGAFVNLETCQEEGKCSATGGNCLGLYCLPGQRRCLGDRLERCDSAQSAFELEAQCAVGLCDANARRCNACVPSATVACFDGKTRAVCSDDGQTQTNVACAAASPNCVSDGSGVSCRVCGVDAHCSTTEVCRAPKCTNGTCGTGPDPGQDGRVIVPAQPMSCLHSVCRNGIVTGEYLPMGAKCGVGQGFDYYCSATGECLPET